MTRPRCNEHKDRDFIPTTCATCRRIALEQRIVKRVVGVLLHAGYRLQTDNGGDVVAPEKPTAVRSEILAELNETDTDYLVAIGDKDKGLRDGWVLFVYGNDGYDVISDYTLNLEEPLAPVLEYCNGLER